MDVRLLGHLEVEVSGDPVRFEGAKQRRLFAMLALRGPEAVSADELVEALWGAQPPSHSGQALQKQISRLRQRLGDGGAQLRHRPPGNFAPFKASESLRPSIHGAPITSNGVSVPRPTETLVGSSRQTPG